MSAAMETPRVYVCVCVFKCIQKEMFTLAEGEFTVSIFLDQISVEHNSREKRLF